MLEERESLFLLFEEENAVKACFTDGFAGEDVAITSEDGCICIRTPDGSTLSACPTDRGEGGKPFRETLNEIWNCFRLSDTEQTGIQVNLLHQLRLFRSMYHIHIQAQNDAALALLRHGLLDTCCNGGGLRLDQEQDAFWDEDNRLVFSAAGGVSDLSFYTVKELPQPAAVSAGAASRRARTLELLAPRHIYIPGWLPALEYSQPEDASKPEAVTQRLVALALSALYADGVMWKKWSPKQSRQFVKPYLEALDAESFFSARERDFMALDKPLQDTVIEYSWNYEHAWTLFWALGHTDALDFPDHVCDASAMADSLKSCLTFAELMSHSTLRPREELLAAADLYFCYHWSALDVCGQMGLPAPAGVDPGVVAARQKTLSWLADGGDWDLAGTRMS